MRWVVVESLYRRVLDGSAPLGDELREGLRETPRSVDAVYYPLAFEQFVLHGTPREPHESERAASMD
jgi:hypothetical protein